MKDRQRLSATIEPDLLRAGRRAVAEGRARSLSSWVNDALKRQAEHDRRMKALDAAIKEYEREHGAITDEDIREATRYFSARAIRVRPETGTRGRRARGTRAAG